MAFNICKWSSENFLSQIFKNKNFVEMFKKNFLAKFPAKIFVDLISCPKPHFGLT